MFGGKKLKDLTEEDIRRYAASLASQSASKVEAPSASASNEPDSGPAGEAEADSESTVSAPSRPRQIAEAINEHSVAQEEDLDGGPDSRARALERVLASDQREERERLEREVEDEEERRRRQEAEKQELQARLSEEERLRLEVLAELERSQMPAVQQDDGALLKTIEHYTFADSNETATIYIDLDKDLFEGAAAHIAVENVEVATTDTEVTILLHKLPASKTVPALADWRLHLAPLFHSVVPDGTSWKV